MSFKKAFLGSPGAVAGNTELNGSGEYELIGVSAASSSGSISNSAGGRASYGAISTQEDISKLRTTDLPRSSIDGSNLSSVHFGSSPGGISGFGVSGIGSTGSGIGVGPGTKEFTSSATSLSHTRNREREEAKKKATFKSGRQRKRSAARAKGGDFQQHTKKRVYFCSISSELDVEGLQDDINFSTHQTATQPEEDIMEGRAWRCTMFQEVLHIYIQGYGNGTVGPDAHTRTKTNGGSSPDHGGSSSQAQGNCGQSPTGAGAAAGSIPRSNSSVNIEKYDRTTAATNPVHAAFEKTSFIGGISNSNASVSVSGSSSGSGVHGGYPSPDSTNSTNTLPNNDYYPSRSTGSGSDSIAGKIPIPTNTSKPTSTNSGYMPLLMAHKRNQNSANLIYDTHSRRDIPNNAVEVYASVATVSGSVGKDDYAAEPRRNIDVAALDALVAQQHADQDDREVEEGDSEIGMGQGHSSSFPKGHAGQGRDEDSAYEGDSKTYHLRENHHDTGGNEVHSKDYTGTAAYLWNSESKECFVFAFGGVVLWGFTKEEEDDILDYIRHFASKDLLDEEEITKSEDDMAFAINTICEPVYAHVPAPAHMNSLYDQGHTAHAQEVPGSSKDMDDLPRGHARTYTEDLSGTDQDNEVVAREEQEYLHPNEYRMSHSHSTSIRDREKERFRSAFPRDPNNTYVEKGFVHNLKNQGPKGINIINRALDADPASEKLRIDNDVIYLPEATSTRQRLALSFAVAQSSVLAVFEARIQKRVEEYRYIPETYAANGKLRISAKQLGNMIGEVFVIRHDVNLHTEILDTPDWFWNQRDVEELYKFCAAYLEMENRTNILNTRLDMLKQVCVYECNFSDPMCILNSVYKLLYILCFFIPDRLVFILTRASTHDPPPSSY